MQVKHLRSNLFVERQVERPVATFLRNEQTWFSQFTSRQTRYEGWFLGCEAQLPHTYFKFLERVTVTPYESLPPQEITVMTNQTRFSWEKASLTFALSTKNGMVVQASQPVPFQLTLDMRGIYSTPDMGRIYRVQEENGLLISYQDDTLIGPLFLHIRGPFRARSLIGAEWKHYAYPRDTARNSGPDNLYCYELPPLLGERLNMGCGFSKEEALAGSLEAEQLILTQQPMPNAGNAQTIAQTSVVDAMGYLTTKDGVYAGFPWFHQFWSRDELITGLGLPHEAQIKMIERYVSLPLEHGELPTYAGSGTTCADGIGWLALLMKESGYIPSSAEVFFKGALEGLNQSRRTPSGLIWSGHNATWMDTIGRSGFRLEIQCMYALVQELLFTITGENQYREQQKEILQTIRHFMFVEGRLLDGLEDDMQPDLRVRPNIFLAYLLQPSLLDGEAWEHCFETAILELSTPWGGLASLSSRDSAFQPLSTGENNHSYHQGDSWFFVNNLAALAIKRHGSPKLQHIAEKLLASSTEEVLWQHFLGMPGEIASAQTGESWGCGIQGFSGGAYLKALGQ